VVTKVGPGSITRWVVTNTIEVHLTDVHLMGVYLTGVHLMGVYLIGVHLIGVYLMGVYLMGVHLMGVYLINVHLTTCISRRAPHGLVFHGGPFLSCKIRVFAGWSLLRAVLLPFK
jgi:uncharacterized protein YjbI with pentapeptide repeats